MWKKMIPLFTLSAVLLVGCNSNNAVPKKNETPMEDLRDDARQWKNDVERDVEGRNFDDGNMNNNNRLDDGNMNNNNRLDDGNMNNNNGLNDGNMNNNNGLNNGVIQEENTKTDKNTSD